MKQNIQILSVPIPRRNASYFFIEDDKFVAKQPLSHKGFIQLIKLCGWSKKKKMCSLTHTLLFGRKVTIYCSFNPEETDTGTNFTIDEVYAVVPKKLGRIYDAYLMEYLAEKPSRSSAKKSGKKNNQETIPDPE